MLCDDPKNEKQLLCVIVQKILHRLARHRQSSDMLMNGGQSRNHRVSHSCARLASKGVLVPKGRDIPLFSPERGGICGVSATIAMREMRAMRRGCKSGISAGILARSVVGVYFGHNDATELRARVPFLLI